MAMDLTQLETFVAVAEERSFSRAAVRLHRTQPAVSQTIRKLEVEVGEILLDRAARDGSLTAAGEVLLEYAQKLLNLRVEATGALGELRALHTGRLNLAANEYTCLYLLPVLDRYRREYPQIKVSVRRSLASRIADQVQLHDVEMGILSFVTPDPALQSIVVYHDELVFVVSPEHPMANAGRVHIRDLGAENFIAHNVPSPLRQTVIQAFQKNKTPLNMGVELPSLEAIKRFVAMGNGVAFMPGLVARPEVEAGRLVPVKVQGMNITRKLRLVYRRHATLSYAAGAFLETVEQLSGAVGRPFDFDRKAK
jgi:DNA-binding transcriptional LysR family regulator